MTSGGPDPAGDLARQKRAAAERLRELRAALAGRPDLEIAAEAARAADRFILACFKRTGRPLGYSLDAVRDLDRVLSDNFYFSALSGDDIYSMGCYFGELIRRNFGGTWIWHPGQGEVAVKVGRVYTFPLEKLHRALRGRKPEPLEAYVFVLARKQGGA